MKNIKNKSNKKAAKNDKLKLGIKELSMEWKCLGRGLYLFSCYAESVNWPVGSCWLRLESNNNYSVAVIGNIFVTRFYRRNGVATFMYNYLLESYDVLRTNGGSPDGGLALMKKMGWKRSKDTGDWYLHSAKKKQNIRRKNDKRSILQEY